MRLRSLYKLPDGKDWQWEKLGLALVGRTLLSKALIQSSADGWGWALSLVVFWPEATQPLGLVVVVVQSLSHVQIFETPLTAAGRTSPVFDHFPELAQTPVH